MSSSAVDVNAKSLHLNDVNESLVLLSNHNDKERCAICLDDFSDRAVLQSCFHAFCFACVTAWAKLVMSCPLCKTPFTDVLHNIKDNGEHYEMYSILRRHERTASASDMPSSSSTTTSRYAQRHQVRQRNPSHRHCDDNYDFRQSIYARDQWVRYIGMNPYSRFREDVTPSTFRNPHDPTLARLRPWLERELSVLVGIENMYFVAQWVIRLIQEMDVRSDVLKHLLQQVLFDNTEHFIHELWNFIRAPFDLTTYDRVAQYGPAPSRFNEVSRPQLMPLPPSHNVPSDSNDNNTTYSAVNSIDHSFDDNVTRRHKRKRTRSSPRHSDRHKGGNGPYNSDHRSRPSRSNAGTEANIKRLRDEVDALEKIVNAEHSQRMGYS